MFMTKNIFVDLKMDYEFLTKVEKKIADLLLADPQKFITHSIAELSRVCGVSQGSINNFSKKFSSGGYAALKLRIAGRLSNYEETPFTVVDASMLSSQSLVIVISSSGRTKEILDAVEIAKKNDVPVICLTAHKSSPIATISDDVLLTAPSGISISDRSSEIRLAQLFLLDALCAYLQSIIDSSGNKRYYRLQEILNSHDVYN